ncbi:MAG: helix-hairpin-helix domain-containing protein [Anaerolineae bacterium]
MMDENDEMFEGIDPLPEPEPRDRAKTAILEAAEGAYGARQRTESVPEEGPSEGEAIDLNSATEEELRQLAGIGPVLAGRIAAYRQEHGPFVEPAEIMAVQGISQATYEAIADQITAGGLPPDLEPDTTEAEAAEPEEEAGEEPADALEEETRAWEFPVSEVHEELPEPEGLEAAEEGRVLPEPEEAAAEPSPLQPELPKQKVVVEHREAGGWGRLLLTALGAALAGAALALLVLYVANGTLSFGAAANRTLAGTVSRLEAGIEASRIELGLVEERLGQIDELRTELAQAEGDIDDLARGLEAVQADLQSVDQGLSDIRQTLSGLSDDLVSMTETLTAVDEQVGAIDGRLTIAEGDLAAMEGQLDAVQEAAKRFDAFLTGLRELLLEAEGLSPESQPLAPTPTAWETLTPVPSPTPQPEVTVIPLATPTPSG